MRFRLRRLGRTRLAAAALGVIAVVLIAAGCGKSSSTSSTKKPGVPAASQLSKGAYRLRLKRIKAEVTTSNNAVRRAAAKAKSPGDLRNALKKFGDDDLRLSQEIGKLRPPRDAIKANRLLAKGFADTAQQIRALLPKISSAKSKAVALRMLSKIHPAGGKELDRAIRELTKLGYTTGS